MIICRYNCKFNTFILNILYTFSPLLGNSIDLDPAQILFLYASIACESQIQEIRCDNRLGLYVSNGFNILGPLLHIQYSVYLYSSKISLLYSSISYESQI